jgi:hypothetical protein
MWTLITDGFQFLYHQSAGSLVAIFWLTLLFDIPRYALSFLAAGYAAATRKKDPARTENHRVSVLLGAARTAYAAPASCAAVASCRNCSSASRE